MLYFAFGSNLNVDHMRIRCPAARPLYALTLENAALVFRGVADIEYRKGAECVGGVWRITKACEEALDVYEGVESGLYVKRYFDVKLKKPRNGRTHRPVLYYKMRDRGVMPPPLSYFDTIAQGYNDFELDLSYLNKALEESYTNQNKTPRLRARYQRKGRPPLATDGCML